MKARLALPLLVVVALCGCGSLTTPTPEEYARSRQRLAEKGDTQAAFDLAKCYAGGYGVPLDFEKAEHWFEIGATTPEQKAEVAGLYVRGEHFPKDIAAAARWYTAAGRPGDFFELGEIYKNNYPAQNAKAANIYLDLLRDDRQPEFRRAQLELGNFVIDGIYSAGSDAKGRALNLEWARLIAQELLGQKEYQIAVEYQIGQEDLPSDEKMWLRYCKRAAAYNIDHAQHYYVEALGEGKAPDLSGYDYVAWTRVARGEQTGESKLLKAFTAPMSEQQVRDANAAYKSLIQTRARSGAYYPADDPLRNPSEAALAAMPQDDPDVQLREAFSLEQTAVNDEKTYERVLAMYRTVRNHRDTDARFVLGRYALFGTNGIPKNRDVAEYWLNEAVRSGSKPAQELLTAIGQHPAQEQPSHAAR